MPNCTIVCASRQLQMKSRRNLYSINDYTTLNKRLCLCTYFHDDLRHIQSQSRLLLVQIRALFYIHCALFAITRDVNSGYTEISFIHLQFVESNCEYFTHAYINKESTK